MTTRTKILRAVSWAAVALGLALAATRAHAARREPAATRTLHDVGVDFEARRVLPAAQRLAALEELGPSVTAILRGGADGAAARMLAGQVAFRLGDWERARESFRSAREGDDGLADDAGFAAIQALEAAGRDADAAREWMQWEKRHPQSTLMPMARLARAWNAIRRGEITAAHGLLDGLRRSHPWLERDARFALARAAALHFDGKSAEALRALGGRRDSDAAIYLEALALQGDGALLRAAAAFQDVAERHPDSPLRDHALLAKANCFLIAGDYRSAAEDFARVARRVSDPAIRAEAELRRAGAAVVAGDADSALARLRAIVDERPNTEVAARAQFLVGDVLASQGRHAEAIVELNQVLTRYFQHQVAASAQYRVARCLDRLGRATDATGSYQAVVKGYPLEPEAPAAAYLAGVGLLRQGRPLAAAPYFQLVLDRYARTHDPQGRVVFASPAHQELVEAALCLLEYSYREGGNLGQLTGAPHLLLTQMPDSRSPWRAWALLIDADAMAAQARYPEAQTTLEKLITGFPDHSVAPAAMQLLAWTYARQGRDSLAVATEERLLARHGASAGEAIVSGAFLDIAHQRFNQKRYRDAAGAYEDFLRRFPAHPRRLLALYQAGLCYLRLDRAGDAVDRWERIVRDSASAAIAERAWARAGDVYFQAEKYDEARRCYRGLLEHFDGSAAASIAMLRLGQCEYNAGRDATALESFAKTQERFPGTPAAKEAARGTERALYRLSQTAGGATVLQKLVEQYPGSAFAADAMFQIGKRRYREKQWTAAAEDFRRVVSQFPGYSGADQAQFLLAECHARSGDAAEAQRAYEQFGAFFPKSALGATVQFRLGLMRFENQEYAQAAVAFTRLLADSAGRDVRSAARYNLALCHRLLGASPEARAELEAYAREFPGDERAADVAYQLGDLDESAGQWAAAARQYERALAARPAAALAVELRFRLGRTHEQLGQPAAALAAYQQAAAAADPDDPFRLTAVARCAAIYEARKEFTRARGAYRDIVRNAKDRELVAAANARLTQLEAGAARR